MNYLNRRKLDFFTFAFKIKISTILAYYRTIYSFIFLFFSKKTRPLLPLALMPHQLYLLFFL